MNMNYNKIDKWLQDELEKLDISPSNYELAVNRYEAVGRVLETKLSELYNIDANIYVQGSFMLGTVIKPYGKDKEYDIDLVCECDLKKEDIDPKKLKNIIKNALDESIYKDMLDEEGRRTWTILYSENNNIGFHIDIQPSIPQNNIIDNTEILTTTMDKNDKENYKWDFGNPKEFKKWFDNINKESFNLISFNYKRMIYERNIMSYASIEKVPDQLVRTKLQRMIQILKKHRDIRFEDSKYQDDKPNSMIITIMASKVYKNISIELSLYEILKEFANEVNSTIKYLMNTDDDVELPLISRIAGEYKIMNPVVNENLAEKWNIPSNNKKDAFINWANWLYEDIAKIGNILSQKQEERSLDMVLRDIKNKKIDINSNYNKENNVKTINNPIKPWKYE